MLKTYSKEGYSYTDDDGHVRQISTLTITQSITAQKKLKANVNKNISTLEADLKEIEKKIAS